MKRSTVSIELPHSSVYLEGSASSDPDGKIASWKWTQLSGPSNSNIEYATKADTRVLDLQSGNYVFQLKVTDNQGKSAKTKVNVHVASPSNVASSAREKGLTASVSKKDIEITLPESSTILDGSPSQNPDGKIISWDWTQLSGSSTANIAKKDAKLTKVSGLRKGSYTFQLTVTNNDKKSATAKVNVTVHPAPYKKEANLDSKYEIYPNPATNLIHVKLKNKYRGKLYIYIYDINGVVKLKKRLEKNQERIQTTIDISSLPDGIYFIFEKNGFYYSSKKIIKL